MQADTYQLTIRGLNQETKAALIRKADQQGVSLNKYALKALEISAGLDAIEARVEAAQEFLEGHKLNTADAQALSDAVAWSRKTSLEKQLKEDHDTRI